MAIKVRVFSHFLKVLQDTIFCWMKILPSLDDLLLLTTDLKMRILF